MAKVKNISGENRLVAGRLVMAGADLEVPVDEVWSYSCQKPNWAPSDDDAKAAHEAALKAAEPAAEPSLGWTKPELEAYALEHNVDISDANTKADIFAAINHAQEG